MWEVCVRTICFVYLKIASACIPFKEKVIFDILGNGFPVSVDVVIIGILISRSSLVEADLNWLFSCSGHYKEIIVEKTMNIVSTVIV